MLIHSYSIDAGDCIQCSACMPYAVQGQVAKQHNQQPPRNRVLVDCSVVEEHSTSISESHSMLSKFDNMRYYISS